MTSRLPEPGRTHASCWGLTVTKLDETDQRRLLYTTGDVTDLLGVPPTTLKAWESKGFLPSSGRAGSRRRFTKVEMQRIMQVQVLVRRYRFRERVLEALSRGEAAGLELPERQGHNSAAGEERPFSREWLLNLVARNAELSAAQTDLIRRLASAEERFRLLANGCRDIVLVIDGAATITFANSSVRDYGFEPADLVGRQAQQVWRRLGAGPGSPAPRSPQSGSARLHLNLTRADGNVATLNVSISPLHQGQDIAGYLAVATEATERRQL
jgi:PAS domain S-box-containing protein